MTTRIVVFAALFGLLASSPALSSTYIIQSERSHVRFEVGHHDYAKPVRGSFDALSGEIQYDASEVGVGIDVVIDADSIDTANRYRDGHLRDAFFETDRFPEIRFRATGVDAGQQIVSGELTMKGVTRPVAFRVTNVREFTAADGTQVLRCRALGKVNRRDFGVAEDADRAEGLSRIMANIQEGLDEFIEDEVEIAISVVAHAN